jgi:hypothetical protein
VYLLKPCVATCSTNAAGSMTSDVDAAKRITFFLPVVP